jgi:hypothetical protein
MVSPATERPHLPQSMRSVTRNEMRDSALRCGTAGRVGVLRLSRPSRTGRGSELSATGCGNGQEVAAFTSSTTFLSTAGLHFLSAYDTGHRSPSSRFAASWKPRVEYR